MRPPWAAIPLTAAHMACSRTPKKTLRPAGSTWKLTPGLKIVLVEAVRSAAPPNSSGTTSAMAFITVKPALRVAMRLAGGEAGNRLLPAGLELALLGALKLRGELGKGCRVACEELLPLGFELRAAIDGLTPVGQRVVGKIKALVLGEAEELFGRRRRRPRPWPRRATLLVPALGEP